MTKNKKVIVITGAGQGLGKAIVETLAPNSIIYALDISKEKTGKLAEEHKKLGHEVHPMEIDVSDKESVQKVIGEIVKDNTIDVLINNAGVDVTKSIEEITEDEWLRVLQVNLYGPFLMSKVALSHMRETKTGHIVNIVSTAAKRAWPNASAYHASKWGLLGFSHAMFTEAREFGVKVTALIAGGMQTPFILERFPDTPLDVLQDPKNVAKTIEFILSQPKETVIPEVMVIPMKETSWP